MAFNQVRVNKNFKDGFPQFNNRPVYFNISTSEKAIFLRLLRQIVPPNYVNEREFLARIRNRVEKDPITLRDNRFCDDNFVDCEIKIGAQNFDFKAHFEKPEVFSKNHFSMEGDIFEKKFQIYPVSNNFYEKHSKSAPYPCYMRIGDIAFKVMGEFSNSGNRKFVFNTTEIKGMKIIVKTKGDFKKRKAVKNQKKRKQSDSDSEFIPNNDEMASPLEMEQEYGEEQSFGTGKKRKRIFDEKPRKRVKKYIKKAKIFIGKTDLSLKNFLKEKIENQKLLKEIQKMSIQRNRASSEKRKRLYKTSIINFNGHVLEITGNFKRCQRVANRSNNLSNFEGELELGNRKLKIMVYSKAKDDSERENKKNYKLFCSIDKLAFEGLGRISRSQHMNDFERKEFRYIIFRSEEHKVHFAIEEKIAGFEAKYCKTSKPPKNKN